MASDDKEIIVEHEWTLSPQARKQIVGVLEDLKEMKIATDSRPAMAAAMLMSMAVERSAMIQAQAVEKIEIMKMQGGPKILKL